MDKEYLTKEKYEELTKELEHLTTVSRNEIAKELDQTGAMGDLRENAEYQQAREDQASLEQRIAKIEDILKKAEIVKNANKGVVGIGSTVTICKKGEKDCVNYKIVGAEEANMMEKKISAHSPLGKAMLGKKKSEVFIFKAPKGTMEYKIIEIE